METIVMSVGGSLIVPNQVDVDFLHNLKKFIETAVTESDRRFVIIVGGGKTYRIYRDAAKELNIGNEDLDRLGITTCALNAHLLRLVFNDLQDKVLVNSDPDFFEPGASSDRVAVRSAVKYNARKLVNLSNIDYVYTADPKTDKSATKIENITWSEFRKLLPHSWDPGLSSPFDPIAAQEAEAKNMEVACINGAKLEELKKYLDSEEFIGTRIHI